MSSKLLHRLRCSSRANTSNKVWNQKVGDKKTTFTSEDAIDTALTRFCIPQTGFVMALKAPAVDLKITHDALSANEHPFRYLLCKCLIVNRISRVITKDRELQREVYDAIMLVYNLIDSTGLFSKDLFAHLFFKTIWKIFSGAFLIFL